MLDVDANCMPGNILNIDSVKDPKIYPKVAETMAKMHLNVDLGMSKN